VLVNSLDDPLAGLEPDRWTMAAVMSHSFSQDTAAVRALAPLALPYVGVLGPRQRSLALVKQAGLLPEMLTGNWHSPIGLDLGGDTPEQVALSIAAEAQAVLLGCGGGKIRERTGPIHGAGARSGEETPFAVHPLACN
jgi:xanthine/CO dehydrogenase XdhC/CoxF family maturation factor